MEGRNYLEQLQFKKQANKQPIINLDFGNKTREPKNVPKPKVFEEIEEGEEPEEGEEVEQQEEYKPQRKEIQMKDLRGKVAIDYDLIMKRLQANNITGVTNVVPKKPEPIVISETIITPKPTIVKTAEKTIIEENEIPSSPIAKPTAEITKETDAEIGMNIEKAIELPQEELPIAEPEDILKKRAVPKKRKIVITGELKEKLPGPEEIQAKKNAEIVKKPRGRQTKKASTEIAMKLTKAEVARRLPKTEKFVVKTSQYYMNNRKLYVHKIKEVFKNYEKELEETGEIASCTKDSSTDFSPLTHQKIVKDYLNLYTPYRGLLLYHGLGSGKSCTSIGIAEGMKSAKEIIIMTPASLATNYFTEIKKCGDVLYRKNQFWEFVGIEGQPDNVELLSKALSLPPSFIEKKQGAWMVDVKKPPNFKNLSTSEQESIDEQLDKMIRAKYTEIHYNGMNRRVMNELTRNNTINPFDNKTIVIDEVHNFVSRIINKLDSKKKDIISRELYNYLLKANNARVVALSGTPIINSPHELSVLFNILRGAIRTWTIPVRHTEGKKISKEDILDMLNNPPPGMVPVTEYDYVDFTDNKIIITRNPIGFINAKKKDAKPKAGGSINIGVLGNFFGGKPEKKQTKRAKEHRQKHKTTKKHLPKQENDYSAYEIVDGVLKIKDIPKLPIDKNEDIDFFQRTGHDLHKDGGGPKDEFDKYAGIKLDESGNISDDQFLDAIKRILRANEIEVLEKMMKDQPAYNTALPDNEAEFEMKFIDSANKTILNPNVFKRRILGLTSYFRSAQESLLPDFIMNGAKTYHVERVDMSEHQLDEYTRKRLAEIEERKKQAKTKGKQQHEGAEDKIESSTYRVWTREVCNFTFPDGISRPVPDAKHSKETTAELIEHSEESINTDSVDEMESVVVDTKYMDRIKAVLRELAYNPSKPRSEQYLTKEGMLSSLSPKMMKMLENIQNPENKGLHLIYSQFRHIEGIGILKLILEANGYAEFKIKSVASEESWELVENEEDVGKPMFALYTGTESEEEKEIIRNIYNGDWGFVPKSIADKLRAKSSNNLYGEIIKVLMITAAGAEGINLRNTRYVHITEPYWNNTRIEQVIGRARRICSHEQLPEELRTIKVYLYITFFGENLLEKVNSTIQTNDIDPDDVSHIETTDEYLLRIANAKEKLNNSFLKAIKESAMDCTLYKNKEGLMCYGVGMDKNVGNDFLSYPNIDQDLAEREDLNVKKTTLKLAELKIEINGVKYAIDKATDNLYDLAKYKNGNIELVGKLIRPGKGKTTYGIAKIGEPAEYVPKPIAQKKMELKANIPKIPVPKSDIPKINEQTTKTKNAFALIHFGNNPKYFELELYFCIMLNKYSSQNIIYMYSETDTPKEFVEQIKPFVYKTVGFDDDGITYNVKFTSKYASFNTLRTCDFIFAYNLTDYENVCIIESDLVIMENIDSIFNLNKPSALCYRVGNDNLNKNISHSSTKSEIIENCDKSGLNGGVMVIQPSKSLFDEYVKALPIIAERGCKYPNEALFEYVNETFYNLPIIYNLSHYITLKLKQYGLKPDGSDVIIYHFNETDFKHLDVVKENWLKNNLDNPQVMSKYRVRKIPILHFEKEIYEPNKALVNNIMDNIKAVSKK